jgi:hypothetical protein
MAGLDEYMKVQGNIFADPDRSLVIRIPAGERIPIEMSLDAPFAKLEGDGYAVRFDRDLFLWIGGGRALLGFDGRNFAEIGDLRGLKEIAGVGEGRMEVGLGVKKSEGAKITMALAAR